MQSKDLINTIRAARIDLLALIEEVGAAAGLLREAEADEHNTARISAMLCIDDSLNIISTVESQAAALTAKLAALSEACASHR